MYVCMYVCMYVLTGGEAAALLDTIAYRYIDIHIRLN